MSSFRLLSLMPSKLRYKLLISFCLTSVLPLLVGIYIASLFVHWPFDENPGNLFTITGVMSFSLLLSILGYRITRELVEPVVDMSQAAHAIAAGKLDEAPHEVKGCSDEIEDLSRSLRTISMNARELLEKVESLSLKDKLTGLYNANYIRERLREEIQRAVLYQKPCSFAYFHVPEFESYVAKRGVAAGETFLKELAAVFPKHLAEWDRAAHIKNDEFAIIFPDCNKKKAIAHVEQIRGDLLAKINEIPGRNGTVLTVSIGVSENPIDGVTADELFVKARERCRAVRTKGPNLIEAFA